MAYIVTVRLALDVASEAEAADGANEILREQQRSFAPGSCLVDYALDAFTPAPPIGADYQEGDAFIPPLNSCPDCGARYAGENYYCHDCTADKIVAGQWPQDVYKGRRY